MSKTGAAAHRANTNRAIRHEALREQLAAKGLESQVLEDIDILRDLEKPLSDSDIARIKAANDYRMAMLKKVFPDLKSVELTGRNGSPVGVTFVDPANLSTATLRELIAQREAKEHEQPGDPG